MKLDSQQLDNFNEQGFLFIKSFYDLETEIYPIQHAIHKIIHLLIKKYALPIEQPEFTPDTFDAGYQDIISYDRKIGGEIYDAVKQIPAFIRLVASEKHEFLVSQLRETSLSGVAAMGYGIRIDNPREEKFMAPWHQEYLGQLRSLDGLTFWSPLVPIWPNLGPVEFCIGSHKAGILAVCTADERNPDKTGAYALTLANEKELISRYAYIAPLSEPGDLIIIDYLTLHRSGFNSSKRSRWSMQMRYFNFEDPTGIKLSWKGSFSIENIKQMYPEKLIR